MNNPQIPCPKCTKEVTVEKTDFFETHICEHCLSYVKIVPIETCCPKPNYRPVKFITASQTIQVREQCAYCGNLKGNAIGGFTQQQREALPLVDLDKRDRRDNYLNNAHKVLYNKRNQLIEEKQKQNKEQWFEGYNAYLESEEWQIKRERVLVRDNRLCQSCLDAPAIQVHHKSYEFVDLNGSEPCFDLVSVCIPCHDRIERMKKENRLKLKK